MSESDLIAELWKQSSPAQRCPHVIYDGQRCRCAAVEEHSAELVCDTVSLQLWCLDGEHRTACMFYPEK